jgi:type I restriction enzyme S subunit
MAAPLTNHGVKTIPTVWTERIVKRDFSVVLGKMLQSQQTATDETEEPYLRSANVQWDGVDVSDVKTMWFSPLEKSALLLQSGDLLVNEGGEVGRSALWNGELPICYYQNAINRVRSIKKQSSPRFLYYWLFNLKHAGYVDSIVSKTTIAHLTAEKLEIIPWPDAPFFEQKRIAAFLDASCAAIDAAVAAKRRQIQTLAVLTEAIIYHAVTKGLKPDVPLKPSGLDWISAVPAHWQVHQVKRMCDLVRGQFTHRPRNDPALYDGPYPFVQTGDITGAKKYIHTYSQTLNELGLRVSKIFPRGTLVMSIAANIGDVAILDFKACFPDSMIGMIPGPKTNLDYLFYLMRAMKGIMIRSAVLSTQLNLNYVRIGTNFAPFPRKKEQEAIAKYLDTKEREILSIKAKLSQQISTLAAYRKSLIHECVTGQRRLTETSVSRARRIEKDVANLL